MFYTRNSQPGVRVPLGLQLWFDLKVRRKSKFLFGSTQDPKDWEPQVYTIGGGPVISSTHQLRSRDISESFACWSRFELSQEESRPSRVRVRGREEFFRERCEDQVRPHRPRSWREGRSRTWSWPRGRWCFFLNTFRLPCTESSLKESVLEAHFPKIWFEGRLGDFANLKTV